MMPFNSDIEMTMYVPMYARTRRSVSVKQTHANSVGKEVRGIYNDNVNELIMLCVLTHYAQQYIHSFNLGKYFHIHCVIQFGHINC